MQMKAGDVRRLVLTDHPHSDPDPTTLCADSALKVEFEFHGEIYDHYLSNRDWCQDNQALRMMAYLGLKPSDFSDDPISKYEPGGAERLSVPIVRTAEDDYGLAKEPMEVGAKRLQELPWAPEA